MVMNLLYHMKVVGEQMRTSWDKLWTLTTNIYIYIYIYVLYYI